MVSLRTLMSTVKQTAVSVRFLKDRVPQGVDVYAYPQLKGKHRSEVFKGKRAVIVLIPKRGSPMGHFICLIPKNSHIEYFSSLGNSWTAELAALKEPTEIFQQLLGKNFIYNKTPLQSGAYSINSCAAWVLCRAFLHKLKLREFVTLFTGKVTLQSSDDIVAIMSVLLFVDKRS